MLQYALVGKSIDYFPLPDRDDWRDQTVGQRQENPEVTDTIEGEKEEDTSSDND